MSADPLEMRLNKLSQGVQQLQTTKTNFVKYLSELHSKLNDYKIKMSKIDTHVNTTEKIQEDLNGIISDLTNTINNFKL